MPFSPFIKNAIVTIADTDVSDEVSNVRWTQATTTATFVPVSGNVASDTSPGAWTVGFTYGEDWELPTSLANYVYEHEFEEVELVFKPKGTGTVEWTAKVIPSLAGLGGAGGAAATSQTTWASTRPVKSTTPPAGE